MPLSNNLLYLLLLFAVLDKNGRLTVTTGILIALGIMLLKFFCNPVIRCAEEPCRNRRFSPFLEMNLL